MKIYMDHSATTPVRKEVVKAMEPLFLRKFGNASSIHSFGKEAREEMEESRKKIARIINAEPNEIIFTSGGTESDNLALKGIAFANKEKGNHIIASKMEHDAILNTCKYLEKQGFKITYLNVNSEGIINLNELKKSINDKTILVSIMHANNEIGTIQPIEEIGKICSNKGIYFHTDVVQTFCKEKIDVKTMNISLLSASSHKIYGPKGVGFMYVKKGTKIISLLHGGGHEFGIRSGTENIPGIVGFAKAAEIANKEMAKENARLKKLRDKIIKELLKIKDSRLNGSMKNRLSNNINMSFRAVEGESLILSLDAEGIAASTGSACSSRSLEPSHVLVSLGLKPIDAHGSLRLTLGKDNNDKDVKEVINKVPKIIKRLRMFSPKLNIEGIC
ncbi:MAG: cysteine desulfurase NifS [Nanoarchaeota archaeon]|nr:cysteine desulfurase NifS [Nanoarchaeota archaeon]